MTAYTKSTNFATKDTLTSGDPLKIVKGTEINTEFDNIATAVNSKSNTDSPTFTNTVTIPILAVTGASTMTGAITVDSTTDSTSTITGSIQTDGGLGVAKAIYVGTTANVAGAVTLQSTLGVTGVATLTAQPILSSLTASSAVATDASKGLVSVTNTGTGNNVLATSPTLVTPILGTPTSGILTNCTGINYDGFKNRIINGNFGINQRGVSGTVTLTAGSYGHDRFKGGASGCTYTFATSANITTLTITAGSLIQVIEGTNLETATYTLSFSGTAQGKIGAGSFSSSGVTGSVTGGSDLNIEFNTGTLSLVQLEKGSTATSFDFRSIGTELNLAQRYFQLCRSAFGGGNTTTQVLLNIVFRSTMRSTPDLGVQGAISITDGSNDFVQSSGQITNVGTDSNAGIAVLANFTGLTVSRGYSMRLANSNAITLSAEL